MYLLTNIVHYVWFCDGIAKVIWATGPKDLTPFPRTIDPPSAGRDHLGRPYLRSSLVRRDELYLLIEERPLPSSLV